MKKWIFVLAVLSLLGALSMGCQKDDSSAIDKAAAQNASDPTKMRPAAAAPPGGKGGPAPPPP